ncbi:MAG: DMT family transporter [Pseudomonadota bacterium]|nr:DMT family transporter [Pseudomonadota bacterium]
MNRDLGAAAIILTAVLLMTIADAMIKAFMGDFGLWQLFLTRAPFALALLVGLAAVLPARNWRRRSAWAALCDPWVSLRSVLIVLMYLFMYMSFPYLKLAVMGAAFFIAPIFTALMAALFLKDRVGLRGWLGVALGFIGVMVVSRPGTSVFQPAIFLPVIAGLCYSFAAVLTRAKLRQSNTLGVALSLNLILMILSGLLVLGLNFAPPPAAWVEHSPFMLRPWAPMAGQDWAAIVVMAVLVCGITVLLALAYQVGRTVLVATLEYSYLIYAGVIGFVFLGEVLDGFSLLGMAILVTAGVLVVTRPGASASASAYDDTERATAEETPADPAACQP